MQKIKMNSKRAIVYYARSPPTETEKAHRYQDTDVRHALPNQSKNQSKLSNLIQNNDGKTYNGTLSMASARKVKQVLQLWRDAVQNTQIRLTMTTLTYSSMQNDHNFCKRKHLNSFICCLKHHKGLKHYFWRAELQTNGNIHFHIVVDVFCGAEVQSMWADIVRKSSGKSNVHSGKSNVHSTKFKHIEYLTKNKSTKNTQLQGRIYGMSDGLRNIKEFTRKVTLRENEFISCLSAQSDTKTIKIDTFVAIYIVNTERCMEEYATDIYDAYEIHRKENFKLLYS